MDLEPFRPVFFKAVSSPMSTSAERNQLVRIMPVPACGYLVSNALDFIKANR